VKSQRLVGIFLALVSAVFFAMSNTLAGVAYKGGSNPFTLSATRFILPSILLFFILMVSGKAVILGRRPAVIAAFLGIVSVVYTFALLMAIELLPVTIAILIFYLFPILTAFILAAFGSARLTARMLVSTFIVFFGLSLALAVQFGELNVIGMLAGLVSAIGFAVVCSVSNRLMYDQDSRLVTLYLSAAATVTMIVVSCFVDNIQFPLTTAGWTGFLLSNVLYAAAIIGFYRSIAMVGASMATFFVNLEPIVVIGAGYIFLNQMISSWQMVGVAIVVGALIYASQPERAEKLSELV
jgi:DME family drug/metabolite transporter